jgi:predicted molibdopterin-dependent oxidoreductase YjgC
MTEKWDGPQKLREKYKRYKAGIISEDDLTEEEKYLLQKYYGL